MKKLFFLLAILVSACHAGDFPTQEIGQAVAWSIQCIPTLKDNWRRVQPLVVACALPVACGIGGIVGTRYWLNATTQTKLYALEAGQRETNDKLAINAYLTQSVEQKTNSLIEQVRQMKIQLCAFCQWLNRRINALWTATEQNHTMLAKLNNSMETLTQSHEQKHAEIMRLLKKNTEDQQKSEQNQEEFRQTVQQELTSVKMMLQKISKKLDADNPNNSDLTAQVRIKREFDTGARRPVAVGTK